MTSDSAPCSERTGRVIRLELSQPTPSLNTISGHHWGKLRKYKRQASQEILAQIGRQAPAKPFSKARVEIARYGQGKELDHDNLVGGAKALVDCLKKTEVKVCVSRKTHATSIRVTNSFGRGIIEDDDKEHIVLVVTSIHVKTKLSCRTIVVITELLPCPGEPPE